MAKYFGHMIAKPDGSFDIAVGTKALDDRALAEFEEVIQPLLQFQPLLITYASCEHEFAALNKWPEDEQAGLEEYGGLQIPMYVMNDLMVEAVRRVGSYLASASAFLGQAEKHVAQRFGQATPFAAAWNTLRRDLHAGSIGYRILYELRNFAQHFALPLGEVNVNGRLDEQGRMVMTCGAYLSRDGLLASGYEWRGRQEDIVGREPMFDVLPLANDYQGCLRRLIVEIGAAYAAELQNCALYFQTIRRIRQVPNDARLWLFEGRGTDGHPPTSGQVIPEEQLLWLIEQLRIANDGARA
jgi:hypothetical protein